MNADVIFKSEIHQWKTQVLNCTPISENHASFIHWYIFLGKFRMWTIFNLRGIIQCIYILNNCWNKESYSEIRMNIFLNTWFKTYEKGYSLNETETTEKQCDFRVYNFNHLKLNWQTFFVILEMKSHWLPIEKEIILV